MAELSETQAEQKPLIKPKYEASDNLVASNLYVGVAEKTVTESPYHYDSLERPYNPDDLFKKSGDYSIYEDMLKDDQVGVCIQLKKDLVIGSGWDIVCTSDEHEEIANDIKVALMEDPAVSFDDSLQEIISAYEFGFSLTEKVFKHRDDGSLTLNMLKTRHPATWLIWTDEKGNVSRYMQYANKGDLTVEPKSLIHYVNNRKFQNPYGTSDLRAAYNAWFTKRQIIRYFAIFLEKAASPTPIAKYDKNAPQEAVTAIFNALKSFQTKTALAIPKDIEVEFLEANNNGDVYEKAINLFNTFIGRALFIPDLLGFSGGQTSGGSLALGKEQMSFFIKHIQRRRKQIEDIINSEIIWPIVFYNWGFVDNYPKFKLRPINDQEAIDAAKIWLEAVKGKVYTPSDSEVNYFRSLVKFPEGEVDRPQPAMALPMASSPINNNPGDIEKPDSQATTTSKETEEPGEDDKKTFALGKLPPGEYCKKCDFKMIKRELEGYDAAVLRDVEPFVKEAFEDLYGQIRKKKIIQSGQAEKIESLKIKNLGRLKNILKRSLREVFAEGGKIAASELLKGVYAKPVLPTDEFLALLEQELFQYIGDWEYQITKKARLGLIEAIKDGNSLSDVIGILDDEGMEMAMTSIERYARTKHTEVFNKGRLDYFESTGLVSAYQYSAILDDSTTEICAGLDGKIFPAGEQPIPPMHFNCRSMLVPITKYEEWDADKSVDGVNIDKFIEDNKGQGFGRF